MASLWQQVMIALARENVPTAAFHTASASGFRVPGRFDAAGKKAARHKSRARRRYK